MTPASPKLNLTPALQDSEVSRLWEDFEASNATAALAFSEWLDADLKRLEDRYRGLQTPRSVSGATKRQAGC